MCYKLITREQVKTFTIGISGLLSSHSVLRSAVPRKLAASDWLLFFKQKLRKYLLIELNSAGTLILLTHAGIFFVTVVSLEIFGAFLDSATQQNFNERSHVPCEKKKGPDSANLALPFLGIHAF